MNFYNLTKCSRKLLLALALGGPFYQMNASPIEQIGDRYIVHVPELDLRGDESLLDILMMCPDVITLDGRTTLSGNPLANLYGKYVIRFDNVEYGLDYNTLLHNLKAREIEKIQVCMNADVMKGTGSQKKVIDIHLRKDVGEVKGQKGDYYAEGNNGKGASGEKISGRVGLFGDTYGGAEAITSVRYHGDNLRLLSHVEGNMQRSAIDGAPTNHRSHEGAKVNMIWDITSRDNLEITATQTYTRNRLTGNPADYERYYNAELDYTRILAENGANMLFTLGTDHTHDRSTYPYTIWEFNFPLFTQNLWITAGFEGGLAREKDDLTQQIAHSDYEDFYVQADLSLGKWGFMVGDRYRRTNASNHNAYTLSAYHHLNEHRTLQASFSQQFYNAALGDIDQKPVYRVELKHTYQQKKFILSTVLRYFDQDLNEGRVKTFNFGNTLFWHIGMLRLTAGISSYKEELKRNESNPDNKEEKTDSQYFVFKLAPQLSLPGDWRFTATMLWSTHRPETSLAYAPANLYAEAAVYKTFSRHWLLEARYHDIASQHLGNRTATIGCTYYF